LKLEFTIKKSVAFRVRNFEKEKENSISITQVTLVLATFAVIKSILQVFLLLKPRSTNFIENNSYEHISSTGQKH
jgi:hypothetical protein